MGQSPRATVFFGVLVEDVDWDEYSESTPVDEYGDRCSYEVCEDLSSTSLTALPYGYDNCDLMLAIPGTETTGDWNGPTEVTTAPVPPEKIKAFSDAVTELGLDPVTPEWLMAVEYS